MCLNCKTSFPWHPICHLVRPEAEFPWEQQDRECPTQRKEAYQWSNLKTEEEGQEPLRPSPSQGSNDYSAQESKHRLP